MKQYFTLVLILVLSAYSCKNDIAKRDFSIALIVKKNITIPIKTSDYYMSWFSHVVVENDTTYIYRKDYHQNVVNVYNWETKTKIKEYLFKDEGPNKINKFNQAALIPIAKDSFFIGSYFGDIYITVKDSVKKHLRIKNKRTEKRNSINDKSELYFMMGRNESPPIFYKNTILCNLYGYDGELGSLNFFKSKLLMSYNLDTDEYKKLSPSFPPKYYGHCWGGDYYDRSFTINNKNQLIYLFGIEPKLYVYDLNKDKFIDTKKFNSRYVNKEITPIKCRTPFKKRMQDLYSKHRYKFIRYDKYRNIYYLLTILPLSTEEIRSNKLSYTLSPFSIIVLNENLEVITEKKFTGKIYNFVDYFVTSEGLWLSKNNPLNENFKENELKFSLLTLDNNDK